MRAITIAGGDGVSEMRLLAGVQARGRRHCRVQREHAVELCSAGGLVDQRAAAKAGSPIGATIPRPSAAPRWMMNTRRFSVPAGA
ncbi:hypothetical protein [Sphingopyxis sp. YF1]|jgi:hypothetical protein|uniref:hypothetical protein n=1 Tax=Sphingopyxis sp. YF1 TaxID=2482763 RepID=UPI001F60EA65|nr:hypothetical protein [Sphingopyxis sp. YF1]